MKLNRIIAAAAVVALCIGPASAKVVDTTIATVNGKAVMSSDYDKVRNAVLSEYQKSAPKLLESKDNVTAIEEEVLNQMISNELLLQATKTENIKVKDSELAEGINEIKGRFGVDAQGKQVADKKEVEKAFNAELKKEGLSYKQFETKIREQIAVRKLVDSVVKAKLKQPTKEEAKALFEAIETIMKGDEKKIEALPKNTLEIAAPLAAKLNQLTAEQVKISPIFIKTEKNISAVLLKDKEKQAAKIKKDIEKGNITFVEAIEKYSDDKTALSSGGEVTLVRGVMPKDFDTKVFNVAVGAISEPIKTEYGIYVIRVNSKTAKKDFTFQQIEPELAQILTATQMKQIMSDYMQILKDKADIKVMKKFEYSQPLKKAMEEAAKKQDVKPATKPAADKK